MTPNNPFTRRQFLIRTGRISLGLGAAAVLPGFLAACGDDDDEQGAAATATAVPTGVSPATAITPAEAQEQATVLVGDVVDFRLLNEEGWTWPGGWVTMRLHAAAFNGQPVYFVRTDSSDEAFAGTEKLVYVPKLAGAIDAGKHGEIYLVEGGVADQLPVVSTAPDQLDFTPLLRVNRVFWSGEAQLLESAADIEAASASGALAVDATEIIVNYPFVKWSVGELPVDTQFEAALSGGPLAAPLDLDAMTATFKLHQCYPESYYIITDTSAAAMTGMMNVAAAPEADGLVAAGATEPIYVFGNGIPGFAAMGFQPSVFASKAGEPAWSPMWEHVTCVWADESAAQLLASRQEVAAMEEAGELQLFPGTPDTNGQSFVVNCPAPILAPNTFSA
ncbi:MAG TPA: hypothetical protein VMR52_04300 [Dehalococcoidia bacterium]|nr:hypothetical protein [Dehalococcoidia bacterium]